MNHRMLIAEVSLAMAAACVAMVGSRFIESPARVPVAAQGEGAAPELPPTPRGEYTPPPEPITVYSAEPGEEFPSKKINNAYGW